MTYLIDSHCHLNHLTLQGSDLNSVAQILARARRCGVSHLLGVACTIDEYSYLKKIAERFDGIYTASGIHPLNLNEAGDWKEEDLIETLKDPHIVALGEIGLDNHYSAENIEAQRDTFARQLDLATELKLPVVVHAREAHQDTVALLKSHHLNGAGGVIHCFTDTLEMAKECLDLGYFISVTGIVTFKPSDNIREILKYVPRDRLMLETDSPYLAPVPVRGIKNEPAFVRYTLEYVASYLKLSPKILAEETSANFERLYQVKLSPSTIPELELSPYKLDSILDKPFD